MAESGERSRGVSPDTAAPSRREALAAAAGMVLTRDRSYAGDPLLEAIDLARPDMAAVKTALARGDVASARAAFAHHLRTRASPRWYPVSPIRVANASDRETADRALRHEFESVGLWHMFGREIDWSYDPTAASGSPIAYTPEWTWQLNRHNAWAAMARVFAATGDARYGQELARQIVDWVGANPAPAGRRDDSPRSRWRPIEAGIRMYGSWQQTFQIMAPHGDVFPDDALLAMTACMAQHARYLRTYHGTANRECMEANGLFHVGSLFPELRESASWRDDAIHRLRRELDRQVYPDGAQYELTPAYHALSLVMFVSALRLARATGYPLPEGYEARLERMYDLFARLMQPDRTDPPFNDSSDIDVQGMLNDGLTLFPHRADWRYIASDGREGTRPQYTSHMLPYGGFVVMRSGWERDALYLAMDAGPFGFSHYHEDKLSFVLHAYGSRLVFEAGSYMYDASAMRQYVRSARGHNVVHVDGLEQAREGMPPRYRVTRRPMPIVWRTSPDFDYACATFGRLPGEAWGKEHRRQVVHMRQILFVKALYWLIVDTMTPSGVDEHRYESTFHLDALHADVDSATRSVTTHNATGANLAILPLADDDLGVRLVEGRTEPTLQGWLPHGHGKVGAEPRPTVCYTRTGRGLQRFVYVFAPSRRGDTCPVTAVRPAEAVPGNPRIEVVRPDGGSHHITIAQDGSISFIRADGVQPARFRAI